MAALLVGLMVMAILATAVMPVWKQMAQREKEAELVFRGQQYVRAIALYQRKAGPGVFPPSVDVLVQQKFLRKKFKDPITNDDFLPLPAALALPTTPGQTSGRGATGLPTASPGSGSILGGAVGATGVAGVNGGATPGGIAGVASKSPDKSILIYNGRTHYNEWEFRFIAQAPAGAGGSGGRGPVGASGPGGAQTPQAPFGGGGRGRGNPANPGNPGRGGSETQQPPGGRGFGRFGGGGIGATPPSSPQPNAPGRPSPGV